MTRSCRSAGISMVFAAAACAALLGCGGGRPKPKAPKIIQSPPPPSNLSAVPNKPPPDSAAAAAKNGTGKTAKQSASAAPRKEPDRFADEDPRNIFSISGNAPVVQIGSQDDAAQPNGFVIGEVLPGADATHFEVLAVDQQAAAAGDAGRTAARNKDFELPEGFKDIASFGYSEQGLPWRIRDEKSGAVMALVPAGPARIGSMDGPPESQPEFSPFLEPYYMDVTEVTLEQYQRFRDEIKQKKSMTAQPALNDRQDPNLPALGLPWGNAQGFARWAGKELPTEAEWEYAARGPDGWRTPWGDGRAIWPHGRDPERIAPVASFRTDQSPFGIYDLAGNAREWCSDFYADTAHEEASKAQSRTLRNWSGPKKGIPGQRVVKGNGPDWSAWHRQGRPASERHPDVGFRCVLRVKVPQASEAKGD